MTTTQRNTLANAANAMGGERALAQTLGVSIELLQYWLKGLCEPPERLYLAASNIAAQRPLR